MKPAGNPVAKPRALIVRSAGANCDLELEHAFTLAGANAQRIHLNQVKEAPGMLRDFQILAIPGGFSYGDDIAAGKILAQQLLHHLCEPIQEFIAAGKPIIGICNGFQVLAKMGLLPGPIDSRAGQSPVQLCTLANNVGGRFVDRWVKLAGRSRKCIWTHGIDELEAPIAHGEGRFVPADDVVRKHLWDHDQIALVYAGDNPNDHNPNGSVDDIAGICDSTGLVFGLMPHPERHVSRLQHPSWTSHKTKNEAGPGLRIFTNAVSHVSAAVGAGV